MSRTSPPLLGFLWMAVVLLALAGCGGSGGVGPEANESNGTTISTSIASAETATSYGLVIWLPPGYPAGSTYPVIYAMDCEYRNATLVGVMREISTPAILVNVCAMGQPRRLIDFTMPGAAAYHRFLTRELIPYIDAAYRTDPSNRTLSGHSMSGEFAMYALYLEDPAHRYFSSIVSADCSCWAAADGSFTPGIAEPARSMEMAMYDNDHRLPINLVMAGDTTFNGNSVATVYGVIADRQYQGLRSIHYSYSLGHVQMDGPSFRDALDFIYR